MSAIELREIARDLEQIEMEDQDLTHLMRENIETQEQQDAEEFKGVLSGQERRLHTSSRSARQRCRPTMPSAWVPLLGYGAISFMTLVEVFQLTWPILDYIVGVDTANIGAEFARNPLAVMGGVASALAVTISLIFLWYVLISNAVTLSRSWIAAGPFRSGVRLVGLCFLSVLLIAGTVATANLRHGSVKGIIEFQDAKRGQHASEQPGSLVFVFLTFVLPAASAFFHHKLSQSAYWKQRRDIQAQQGRWDRDENARREAGERRARARELLQKKRARLEEDLARLRARRLALAARVLAAQKEYLEMLDAARMATERHARSMLAALEEAKIQFLRAANRVPPPPPPPGDGSPPAPPPPDAGPYWRVIRPLLPDKRRDDEP
jgi:hypothetical protein